MSETAEEKKKRRPGAPRILIAGTGSGCGKTTLTCGILYGFVGQGYSPAAYKCGPDYIDSMFHSRVLGIETGNLDSFFTDDQTLRDLLAGRQADIHVIEGVMGYYDGMGFTDNGSASEIAALTKTPVILTVNARGMSRSVLAVLRGFLESQSRPGIKGVIFNQLSPVLYPDIRRTMEQLKKKYHLYIVSNCQSGYVEAFLDYYKLHDLIEDTECYGNNEKSKGENIALLYRRNALDDAVYVGDIQGDYDASMDAGIKFIHAAYGFGTIEDKIPEIHKFCELENVADQVLQ